jgi:hypothetical protein
MFRFEIGALVTFSKSKEKGDVVARCEYDHDESRYLVRYVAADGKQTESWLVESALLNV